MKAQEIASANAAPQAVLPGSAIMDTATLLNVTSNPGTAFNPDWLADIRINQSGVERRASTLKNRRSLKKDWQAAWLLRAVSCIDLTSLSGEDTPGRIKRLCAKACHPVRRDILEALGVESLNLTTGAVCVYHVMSKRQWQPWLTPIFLLPLFQPVFPLA